jgi:hypothetical protein
MTFASAINAVKQGNKIHRKNWNGKNQYVCIATMLECELSDGTLLVDFEHKNIGSHFLMFVDTSGYQCGWLASQADMLADDWEVSL